MAPGMPERYQGREEVRAGYRAAWGASPAQPQKIHDVRVHESIDPEVITVEQVVVGTVTTTGQAFSFPVLSVLRVRHGLIVHVQDYIDGLRVARTMDRPAAVVAGLGASQTEAQKP
ncbi:nuclear transport factor 2 family protein [Streptomyces sp. NPDC088353]|uniref:nuclear transport factor 2 family protein n=1 Tax=Streptomyces sp. NPDC088353 TaxID=3365855 RepID=UPI0037F2EC2D